jgi:uncharacterized paraquat-inducible protein A
MVKLPQSKLEKRRQRIILLGIILFVLFLTGMIVSACLEQGFKFYAYVFLTLVILTLLIFAFLLAVLSETSQNEAELSKKATAICPNCGKENPGDAPYCQYCGHPLK